MKEEGIIMEEKKQYMYVGSKETFSEEACVKLLKIIQEEDGN